MEKIHAGKSSKNILADYCQLQTNELQQEVFNVNIIKHLFSYFCSLIYFHAAFLPLLFDSLRSFQLEKVILNNRIQLYTTADSSRM
jgi:hypothetical protein